MSEPVEQRVQVVDRDGNPATVLASELDQAQAAGYTPVTDPGQLAQLQQAAKYGDAPLKAAGLGLLRGLTFGTSDALLAGTDAVSPQALKGYAEQNKVASTLGHAAGALAPIVATGGEGAVAEGAAGAGEGAGLLAQLGRAATAPGRAVSGLGEMAGGAAEQALGGGLAGRLGGAVARGAVEAPLYQVGDNLTEDVFDNKPLTAESLWANVPEAALLGGIGGGALEGSLGLASEYLPRAFKRTSQAFDQLEKRLQPEAAPDVLPGVEVGEAPAAREAPKAFEPAAIPDTEAAQRATRTHLQNAFDGAEDHLQTFFREEKPQRITAMLGDADRAGPVADQLVTNARTGLNVAKEGSVALSHAHDIVDETAARVAAAKNDAERFLALDSGKRAFDRLARFDRELRPEQLQALQPVRDAVGGWRSALEDEKVWGPAAQFQAQTNDAVSAYFDARKALQKPFLRKGLTDDEGRFTLDAAKVSRFVKAKAKGLASNDDAEKLLANYVGAGKGLLSTLQEAVYKDIPAKAARAGDVQNLLGAVDERMGKGAEVLNQAKATAAANKEGERAYQQAQRETARASAQDAKDYAAKVRAGERQSGLQSREAAQEWRAQQKAAREPGLLGHVLGEVPMVGAIYRHTRKTEVLAKIAGAVSKITDKVGLGLADALQGGRAKRAVDAAAPLAGRIEAFDDHVQHLNQYATNPHGASDRLADMTGQIEPHAPALSSQIQQVALAKEGYLSKVAPRNPVAPTGVPGADPKWKPSATELERYERVKKAVYQPLSLIDDLKRGHVSPDAVQAVQATSPQLYQQMRQQLVEKLSEHRDPLTYAQQNQVSMFLGGAPTNYPLQMSPRVQQLYAASPAPQQMPGMGKPSLKGMGKLTNASRSSTAYGGKSE